MMTMRPAMFAIDFLEGKTFPGFTRGEHWNGWACPLFTREQAMSLVDAWREAGSDARYDGATDTFVFRMDDGEQDAFPGQSVEGQHLYPIGAFCWIWDEEATESPATTSLSYQNDQPGV